VPEEFALPACDGLEALDHFQPWFTKSDSRYRDTSRSEQTAACGMVDSPGCTMSDLP